MKSMKRRIALRTAGVGAVAAAALALTANAAFAASQIGPGSPAAPVKCVQEAMNYLDNAGLAVDGSYGPETTAAVETYQSNHSLSVDGLVGPATGGSIKSVIYHIVYVASHSTHPDETLAAWETTCDSLLEGSITT
jgi:peptidoglycan hydrolase-like protein with peptidoglycan-binding domain